MQKDLERSVRWLLNEKYHGPFDKLRTSKHTAAAERDIERLRRGEHVSYVIGWAPFLGVKVDLSKKPLIPRPETEFWTEQIITDMKSRLSDTQHPKPVRILDVFCGSGCIGLAVLKHVPRTRVTFADIDPTLFPGIRKSAKWNKIPTRRFTFSFSNVLKNIGERYDYILANPPYIPSGRKLPRPLAQEPRKALFGGKDGLRYIRVLLQQAPAHLKPDGVLVIEFDSPQKNAIGTLAKKLGYHTKFFKDQYKKWRWVAMQRVA